jgi:hypothetical protein
MACTKRDAIFSYRSSNSAMQKNIHGSSIGPTLSARWNYDIVLKFLQKQPVITKYGV